MNQPEPKFRYEVAFSFLAADEPLATQLNDLLQDRVATFLYSKAQERLVGTDGEVVLNDVFAREARIVVVLYRKGWGEKGWTQVEQTAIRNRAHDEGYEFTILIPLDKPPQAPRWFPKAQIWADHERWGLPGTCALIENRVREAGGSTRVESVADRAVRLVRAAAFRERKSAYQRSHEGIEDAKKAAREIVAEVKSQIAKLEEHETQLYLAFREVSDTWCIILLNGGRLGLSCEWHPRYTNDLKDSVFRVSVWNGHPPFPGSRHFDMPSRLADAQFEFGLGPAEVGVWTKQHNSETLYSSTQLAEQALKRLFEIAQQHLTKD